MNTLEKISKPTINRGIYTISDVSMILDIPAQKVRRWVDEYWDIKFNNESTIHYSWDNGNGKTIDFYTMIEIYVFSELRNSGVKINHIIQAHKILEDHYKTPFPFSNKDVIQGLNTDGKRIYFKFKKGEILSLDGTQQLNLAVIREFFKKVDFNNESLVSKFYPLGKKKNIVVDPTIKFGQPVLKDTGISVETIYDLHLSGEKSEMIAFLYNVNIKDIRDAIKYGKSAA